MTDRDALLAAILANPHDDTPRLVYADYLQENGDDARAEFIRVQVEFARIPAESEHVVVQSPAAAEVARRVLAETDPHHVRRAELRRRERELLRGPRPDIYEHEVVWFNSGNGTDTWRLLFRPEWSRGFVSRVTCTAEDWLRHGDAILKAHPVERVTLWHAATRYRNTGTHERPAWVTQEPPEIAEFWQRWPGVTFGTLAREPEPTIVSVWRIPPAGTDPVTVARGCYEAIGRVNDRPLFGVPPGHLMLTSAAVLDTDGPYDLTLTFRIEPHDRREPVLIQDGAGVRPVHGTECAAVDFLGLLPPGAVELGGGRGTVTSLPRDREGVAEPPTR